MLIEVAAVSSTDVQCFRVDGVLVEGFCVNNWKLVADLGRHHAKGGGLEHLTNWE